MNRLLFILFLLPTISWSQSVKATIDKNRILIGDQVTLYIEVNPSDGLLENINIDPIVNFDSIEIINPGKDIKRENSAIIDRELIITSFDSGAFYIPSVSAVIKSKSGILQTVTTHKIPIYVNTVQVDSTGLAPLKEIMFEEVTWKDYLLYFIPFIILALMILFLWYWNKKQKEGRQEQIIEAPIIPAEIVALGAFDELESKSLHENGQPKEYEVALSVILRRYVEDKFKFPALEWTTREIIKEVGVLNLPGLPISLLQDTLEQSDLVKFAKAKPGAAVHEAQLNKARKFVLETKNYALEEE